MAGALWLVFVPQGTIALHCQLLALSHDVHMTYAIASQITSFTGSDLRKLFNILHFFLPTQSERVGLEDSSSKRAGHDDRSSKRARVKDSSLKWVGHDDRSSEKVGHKDWTPASLSVLNLLRKAKVDELLTAVIGLPGHTLSLIKVINSYYHDFVINFIFLVKR